MRGSAYLKNCLTSARNAHNEQSGTSPRVPAEPGGTQDEDDGVHDRLEAHDDDGEDDRADAGEGSDEDGGHGGSEGA
jgi:hypothetical protein